MTEERYVCPVHGVTDCSPLLNGCSRVNLHYAAQAETPERRRTVMTELTEKESLSQSLETLAHAEADPEVKADIFRAAVLLVEEPKCEHGVALSDLCTFVTDSIEERFPSGAVGWLIRDRDTGQVRRLTTDPDDAADAAQRQNVSPLYERRETPGVTSVGGGLSGTFVDGKPLTWAELVGREIQEKYKLQATARLLSDLDRSQYGRHEGDAESQDPTGTSQGNPHLTTGQTIGYDIAGNAYVVPEPRLRGNVDAWRVPR